MDSCSVIIPTCGRPDRLLACLRALGWAGEVIVSDDGRGDETRAALAAEFPGVRWTRGPGRGPAANRNCGAGQSAAGWLLFLDDDCIPEPGWADAFLRSAGSGRFDVIEGKTFCPDPSDDPFEERVENLFGGLLWSCNLAIRRDAFEALGGFDEEFLEAGGEDMEFAWRIRKAGLRVGFEPGAAVAHPARRGGWRLLWRRTWMIRWIALFDRKTGGTTGKGVFGAWVWRTKMEVLRLLREGWREIAGLRREEWRRPVFGFLVRIVMFPVVLPYLLYWEWRFRERGSIQVERD